VCRSTENAIDNFPDSTVTRRARILDSAARAFAARGYRASSLRDIARDAGCSLTLLDHHFGGKGMLLEAVIKGQHEDCHARLAGLRALLAPASSFVFEDFVALWANYEFDLYATRGGRQYLALMLKLSGDGELDRELRRSLNCSEALVVQAFTRARPSLAEDVLRGGWFVASGALYAAVTSADEISDLGKPGTTTGARARTIALLVDGLHGYWRDAPRLADGQA
jgi:AcrR family transcriptional regulator